MKLTHLLIFVAFFHAMTVSAQQPETTNAVLLSLPEVVMPDGGYGLGGTVGVRVTVNESGDVTDATFLSGPGPVCGWVDRPDVVLTRETALTIARQAKFTPAMRGGLPVSSTANIAVEFATPKRPAPKQAKMETLTVIGTDAATLKEERTEPSTRSQAETAKPDTSEMRLMTTLGSSDSSSPIRVPAGAGASPSDVITAEDGQKSVRGGVLNGKALSLPKPSYPAAARAVRASGAVQIQILIEEDGSVFAAAATAGHPLLQYASVTAACNAKFTPTLLMGQPVKVSGIIVYNFVP